MSQVKMEPSVVSMSFHGIMTSPMTAVMTAPVRNDTQRGATLLKSKAGETTLAAMFVVRVAMMIAAIDTTTRIGLSKRERSATGSHGAASTTSTSRKRK